jgi:hypothetical protein
VSELIKDIPADVDVECFTIGCGERSEVASATPWGFGAFCSEHGAEVVAALPDSFPARVDEFPAWVKDAFAAQGVDVS